MENEYQQFADQYSEKKTRINNDSIVAQLTREQERTEALLQELKKGHAVLLVEHDMDAVFRIADRITVMVNGTVVATGTPDQIRVDPVVRTAYLGEEEHA